MTTGDNPRASNSSRCHSCGGFFPDLDGSTHRYMTSSPGCWAVYGDVLAREYGDPEYGKVHALTVDCYALQHPGEPSHQSIGSVSTHLMRMCASLEREFALGAPPSALQLVPKEERDIWWLDPPTDLGHVTVLDVHAAASAEAHREAVLAWATSLWNAWSAHQEQARLWLDSYSLNRRLERRQGS